jgi:chromosome segregation ATPase
MVDVNIETLDSEMEELRDQIAQEQSQEDEVDVVGKEEPQEAQEKEVEATPEGEVVSKEEDITEPEDQVEETSEEGSELILGKFKSNEDVHKAYKELESKLGKDAAERKRLEEERERIACENEEIIRKNLEWQQWAKDQNSVDSDENDYVDPIDKTVEPIKNRLAALEQQKKDEAEYATAIQKMAEVYKSCEEDVENYPHFKELKQEMIVLAKDMEGQFPELAYNPNAIPRLYEICEAKKLRGDYKNVSGKATSLEEENKKLKLEISKYKKLTPQEEDEAFVEGGSSSGDNLDFESLPLEDQVARLEKQIGRARK